MKFHVADIKKYSRCPIMFYYNYIEKNSEYLQYIRLDEKISDYLCEKLNINNYFEGKPFDNYQLLKHQLSEYEWLLNVRFEYHDLRVTIPLMHKLSDDSYDIKFVSITNFPKEDDVMYYVYHIYVLLKLNYQINDISIIHLNSDYIRKEELDVDKLFKETRYFYNSKHQKTINVKKYINKRMVELDDDLVAMKQFLDAPILNAIKSKKCMKKGKCEYYEKCFKAEIIAADSILNLVSSSNKYQMYADGIISLQDVDINLIEGTKQQYAQIMAAKQGKYFIDKLALKSWMQQLQYPIAFIDFEWDTFAIPPYPNLKPFSIVCFEYSIHILNEDGTIEHHGFLKTQDCREQFIENLIHDLPKSGSIVAFNADGAEKIRLQELAKQFPKLSKIINNINKRMVDFSVPFQNGVLYHIDQKGQFSLKSIYSAFIDQSYQELKIREGMQAVTNWRIIDREETNDDLKITQELLEYCKLDTYSMVKIYQWMKNNL